MTNRIGDRMRANRLFWTLLLLPCLALVTSLAGCFPVSDAIHQDLIGPYVLFAADTRDQLSLYYEKGGGYGVERIAPVVVDVGFDERYVVAARRPEGDPGGPLSYYYLDIAKDTSSSRYEAVTGPLTEEQFADAKAELNLPEFTLHYPDLR